MTVLSTLHQIIIFDIISNYIYIASTTINLESSCHCFSLMNMDELKMSEKCVHVPCMQAHHTSIKKGIHDTKCVL